MVGVGAGGPDTGLYASVAPVSTRRRIPPGRRRNLRCRPRVQTTLDPPDRGWFAQTAAALLRLSASVRSISSPRVVGDGMANAPSIRAKLAVAASSGRVISSTGRRRARPTSASRGGD